MQTWHGFSEEEPTFSVNAVPPRLYMFTLLSRAAFIEVLGCSCLSLRSAGEMPRPREGTDSLPGHRAAGVGGPPRRLLGLCFSSTFPHCLCFRVSPYQFSACFLCFLPPLSCPRNRLGENRLKFGVWSLHVVPSVKFQGLHLLLGHAVS